MNPPSLEQITRILFAQPQGIAWVVILAVVADLLVQRILRTAERRRHWANRTNPKSNAVWLTASQGPNKQPYINPHWIRLEGDQWKLIGRPEVEIRGKVIGLERHLNCPENKIEENAKSISNAINQAQQKSRWLSAQLNNKVLYVSTSHPVPPDPSDQYLFSPLTKSELKKAHKAEWGDFFELC